MTEAEKKELYGREYAKSLEYEKGRFGRYEDHLKIPLKERLEIAGHFKSIFAIMKKCGVKRFDGDEAPMCNVSDILIKLKAKGDPGSLQDFLISNHESCWTTVLFEPTEEEIERKARRSAELEVGLAEAREKRAAEEAERARREKEEREAKNKAEEEHKAKCKQTVEDFQAKLEAKRKAMRAWTENVRNSLDGIRKGRRYFFAKDELDGHELAAVQHYARALFMFTEFQNCGLTGLGLYAQNEERAKTHEDMLEAFGLQHSEYAKEITKSYDFSDDYDCKKQMDVHLPAETVEDMLAFALVEARKKESEGAENAGGWPMRLKELNRLLPVASTAVSAVAVCVSASAGFDWLAAVNALFLAYSAAFTLSRMK